MAAGAALSVSGCVHSAVRPCPASPRAEAEIQRAVHTFYDALRTDDADKFRKVTTERFYSFDGGDRFVGTELVDLVRSARAKGLQFNWSVGQLDTQRQCNVAWTAWENVGSVGMPPDIKPVRWLESAVLVHRGGQWKIDFFHSQRASAK